MMQVKSQTIDHLGIVSGICDEIGLVDVINKIIPKDQCMKLSIGSRVKAMIINGLGFTGRPMYLTPQFFAKRPVSLLVGENAKAEDLNDDSLGRALDALYENNAELIFAAVAQKATEVYKVNAKERHLDTTSISVEGEYADEPDVGIIRFGHSKDLRSDLKQMILSSLVTNDGGIPLIANVLPGNTSDAKHFRNALSKLQENALQTDSDFVVVFDAAGYNKETVQMITSIKWISRVPDTIDEAKKLKNAVTQSMLTEIENGYSILETYASYGGIQQRWIVVYSKQAYNRESRTIDRAVQKEYGELVDKLKKLSAKAFSCSIDAQKAFNDFASAKYHKIELVEISAGKRFLKPGKPKSNDPFAIEHYVKAKITEDTDKIKSTKESRAKFIIATNELSEEKMSDAEVLRIYKNQDCVERGFRFLKNPICMTDSVNLKKQERIVALGVIMFLCLLVYAIAERALRRALEQHNETIPSQTKKPTKTPTMRWVFQMMECVIINEIIESGKQFIQIANLDDILIKIIKLLGPTCMEKYLLFPQEAPV
jgi:transposase